VLTVFLSSTSRDLEPCREAAFRAIEGLHGYHCIRMEDFGSIDETPDDFCRAKVRECDLFVCIGGPLYGSVSPAGSSFTEREFDAAVAARKPCLVFITAEGYPLAANLIEADEVQKRQLAFRTKICKERIVARFSTPDQISAKVVQAIRNWEAARAGSPSPAQAELHAQTIRVFGHDNIVVQASGSGVNVTIGPRPYLRLTQYERRTKLAARNNSEAALLSAYRADVVPLIGRDGEMADLRKWLDDPAAISVRVLVGAGGRGKTRLALELAREISKNWLAGFVKATADEDELSRFRSQNGVHEWRWDKPVLIIIDYAASRAAQVRNWLHELVDALLEDRPKLRLLLLERQANRAIGWLAMIFGQGDNDDSRAATALLDPQEPVEIPTLDELDYRRQVFARTLKRANAALDAPAQGADPEFDRMLGDRQWAGDPLYLMMAGLAAAKSGVRGALSLSRADLALSVARNELDRVGRIGAARGVDEKHSFPGAFVRHMAAIATLTQGLTLAEARELAAREIAALRSTASLDGTITALSDALPDLTGGVAPILPDIVGEGAILAWFGPGGGLAPLGIDPVARIAAAARVSLAKASATLVRTAQDFAAAGYAEPVQWLDALADAPEADLGSLMEIAGALPHQTLALRETAADLYRRIAHALRNAAAAERTARPGTKSNRFTRWR
jgi:hypothetical protein